MKKPNHKRRARRALPHLKSLAAGGGQTTYKDLCDLLGLHHRAARWFLGVIQTWCKENGLPPLQALVVNKRTKRPGMGYTATPRSTAAHRRAMEQVWSFDWSTAPRF